MLDEQQDDQRRFESGDEHGAPPSSRAPRRRSPVTFDVADRPRGSTLMKV
jgi:hypothetical protein